MIQKLFNIGGNKLLTYNFGKWSKPSKRVGVIKEITKKIAKVDERAGKTGKSEIEETQKKRLRLKQLQEEKEAIGRIKEQNVSFEVAKTDAKLYELFIKGQRLTIKQRRAFGDPDAMLQKEMENKIYHENAELPENIIRLPNDVDIPANPTLSTKSNPVYMNVDNYINSGFYKKMQKHEADHRSKRSGALGFKVGMTSLWDKWGTRYALTVVQIDRCQVTQIKSKETDGYTSLQLGLGEKSLKKIKKPQVGHFLKNNIPPKKELQEFKVTEDCILPIGFMITSRHFTPGQYVDVCATCTGKGFQGVIKRWHMKGQPASHGNSLSHRVMGSTGNRQGGGRRVYKGKHMPGRLGGRRVTTQNLRVYKIDAQKGLVYIIGSVPGKAGTVVRIQDAIFRKLKNQQYLNFPTFIPQDGIPYADEIVMNPSKEDPTTIFKHDNDVIE